MERRPFDFNEFRNRHITILAGMIHNDSIEAAISWAENTQDDTTVASECLREAAGMLVASSDVDQVEAGFQFFEYQSEVEPAYENATYVATIADELCTMPGMEPFSLRCLEVAYANILHTIESEDFLLEHDFIWALARVSEVTDQLGHEELLAFSSSVFAPSILTLANEDTKTSDEQSDDMSYLLYLVATTQAYTDLPIAEQAYDLIESESERYEVRMSWLGASLVRAFEASDYTKAEKIMSGNEPLSLHSLWYGLPAKIEADPHAAELWFNQVHKRVLDAWPEYYSTIVDADNEEGVHFGLALGMLNRIDIVQTVIEATEPEGECDLMLQYVAFGMGLRANGKGFEALVNAAESRSVAAKIAMETAYCNGQIAIMESEFTHQDPA